MKELSQNGKLKSLHPLDKYKLYRKVVLNFSTILGLYLYSKILLTSTTGHCFYVLYLPTVREYRNKPCKVFPPIPRELILGEVSWITYVSTYLYVLVCLNVV